GDAGKELVVLVLDEPHVVLELVQLVVGNLGGHRRIQYAVWDSMGKATAEAGDSAFRAIPSVERILSAAPFASLIAEFGRPRVKDAVVDHLSTLRAGRSAYDEVHAVVAIGEALATSLASTLRRVIN